MDLIIVVAWANVTDALFGSEEGTLYSLFIFWLNMNLILCAWVMYVQYKVRFIHTCLLFVQILGLAGMAIHVGDPEFATEFSASKIVQKVPLIAMFGGAAFASQRVRALMGFRACLLVVSTTLCAAVVYNQPEEFIPFVLGAWSMVVAVELPAALYVHFGTRLGLVPKRQLVPINIDHLVDRQNAFIMIALGESVLSAMIKYGSLPSSARSATFDVSMSLVLLMAFSIGLVYYNVQLPREMSAYRQSHFRGFIVYFATCDLVTCILLVSVGVKHSMHAIIGSVGHGGELSAGETWMLHGSLAAVLLLTLVLRAGHYWGTQPRPSDGAAARRVEYFWWALFAAWPVVPLIVAGIAVSRGDISAMWNLGLAAGVCVGLAVADTCFTSWLSVHDAE